MDDFVVDIVVDETHDVGYFEPKKLLSHWICLGLISLPGNNSFWSGLVFYCRVFILYLFLCEILELCWPIAIKFCRWSQIGRVL